MAEIGINTDECSGKTWYGFDGDVADDGWRFCLPPPHHESAPLQI
uniref:Uncharacterized protein n=1 Tax=viral metagenome TaxID=1070528 RepID=A0A6C0LR69_9ZZZZ